MSLIGRLCLGPQTGGVPSSDVPILCYNCGVVVPVGDELSNLNDIARAGMRKSDRLVEQLLKGVIGLAAIANGFHGCWAVMPPPNLVRQLCTRLPSTFFRAPLSVRVSSSSLPSFLAHAHTDT